VIIKGSLAIHFLRVTIVTCQWSHCFLVASGYHETQVRAAALHSLLSGAALMGLAEGFRGTSAHLCVEAWLLEKMWREWKWDSSIRLSTVELVH
jgi:hypothetical protein